MVASLLNGTRWHREWIGWNISQRNDAKEAAWALEHALLRRFGALPAADIGVVLRNRATRLYMRRNSIAALRRSQCVDVAEDTLPG